MEQYWKVIKPFVNEQNKEILNEFLLNVKLYNLSEVTIVSYKNLLSEFFINKEILYSELSSEEILEWYRLNKSHLKLRSYKQHLSVLSSFYNYCVRERLIERSPIKKRWFPRPPKTLPKYLDKREIAKVRQVIERRTLKDQAVFEFFLSSGTRIGEVYTLKIEDVDIKNRTARVFGKGRKIRTVNFSEKSGILLERYLDTRQTTDVSPLFADKGNGKRLSKASMRKMFKEVGEEAGLAVGLHPHRLRHTFATMLLSKGADISFISRELGHADSSTTQIYARLPSSVIISEYRKFMG
ncbi:tyrosine-type recombinase/integrase [Fictibacillus sp. 7GRE50]|uniref:tyrosine-type recombinase/integrase n=1 Tax=Fictibacillus sp. 7GRE50 TaxID=2745878 RepID=UPI0018CDD730|nr:tyrosine-type recombinase/integrase [Fictibacillus sp. 7GRE50]MBH0164094.1 tyrosine-type recombinase/integrase [Fictibacillus sp. 7GRE50]